MEYAVEMGSGGKTYTPSFINIALTIQKLMGDTQKYRHTDGIVIA
jgi:hypothetical protein